VPQPIVIYGEFVKEYTRPRHSHVEHNTWIYKERFLRPMGNFKWSLLTADGERILNGLKSFHLPAPKYRGVSKKAVYFKWDCSVHVTREKVDGETVETRHSTKDAILVAADWVREQGYEVEVEYCPRSNRNESVFECKYCGREKQDSSATSCRCETWLPMMVRKGPVIIDQYKMIIKHPA
jgi:hypothetical protein